MNYSEMTDAELDKLSAEMVKLTYEWNYCTDKTDALVDGNWIEHWNPTHPDSNQAERYLFPKLYKLKLKISTYLGAMFMFTIRIQKWTDIKSEFEMISDKSCNDPDKINRTKVIACLEAWEKLNG